MLRPLSDRLRGGEMLNVRVLGPAEVSLDGDSIVLPSGGVGALLALMAMGRGGAFQSVDIIDALWGEDAPATARNVVQVYVSTRRKALGSRAVGSGASG